MQVARDQTACSSTTSGEDDMTEGDLGDGTRVRPKASSYKKKHPGRSRSQGDFQELLSPTFPLKRNSIGTGDIETFSWTQCREMCNVSRQDLLHGKQLSHRCEEKESDYTSDGDSGELQRKLQEVTVEVELLRSELEVSRRQLEGKHEALKILQGHAILDKATTHTKILLQKSEERTKALEKEVNALQWEINFNQERFKNIVLSWERKYERVCSDNQALSESLEERTKEMQLLKTENTSLNQRCLELLGMLNAKERTEFQGTEPPTYQAREGSVLELAVFGACQCPSSLNEPCPCARSAASSRKQVLQLKQELKTQRRKMEEALVMADAFRISFEQQLRRGSEHVLHLAESDTYKTLKKRSGKERQGGLSIGQRLKGLLPMPMEGKMPKDPYETLHMLLDLLCDKEEALAHQRKVSYMLARNTEDLEKRLHVQLQGNSTDSDLNTNEKSQSGETKEDTLCDSKEDSTWPASEEFGYIETLKTDPLNE